MPKIKLPRNSPSIDMTPMVDLGFLLVTFFMLTAQMRPDEPVTPVTPSSVSEIIIPEKDMMIVTVDKDDKIYYTFDGQGHRRNILEKMGEKYGVAFNEEEKTKFSNLTTFGVPMKQMKSWLQMGNSERGKFKPDGIPIDSLNNEFNDWVYFSRITNPMYRVAIKGDRDANYRVIKKVIKVLGDNKVYKFNLVTTMKVKPQ